ncbi:NCS1 family nucleobase:cation symporter-1 [Humibacillus xanthopallidus]|uniref:NCS1 family nucleobase:cation symporter-1 n=1 Tax=Humibacillus xanthopallidus TaxID=412689 RepID=A0A543PVA3_9MICO|nr:cytosine permease [Humibacillus xanthopallidus]TQN47990.1 NCS1 family nucleobase:cation symporter-1 [Humibacillus xanthopallidus]
MTTPAAEADIDALIDYGTAAGKVEPGGIERIPLEERHGKPWHLFATWMSPNLEFATVFVGVIGVLYFGLSFWQALAAVTIGNALGSITHGILSAWGPRHGLAQMVLSRTAFGYRGNILPATLMSLMAGMGWFAVNSISGAYALATLFGFSPQLALAIVIVAQVLVAFFGHNLIQLFERVAFPILLVVFVIAAASTFGHANLATPGTGGIPTTGAFIITLAAAFGYSAGWNPYASDYTRYLPEGQGRMAGIFAGLGDFVSCTFLMAVGAASATIVNTGLSNDASPTDAFTHSMPGWISAITLLGIALGAVSANVLNIYSGAMSFLAMGIHIGYRLRRAIVAAVFGVAGGIIAYAYLGDPAAYENFLLIIAYWIGPWLAVVFVDRWMRRGDDDAITTVAEDPTSTNWAGPVAMLIGLVVSVWLFSNQTNYVGPVPTANPDFGDSTFFVGFLLSAVSYAVLVRVLKPTSVLDRQVP